MNYNRLLLYQAGIHSFWKSQGDKDTIRRTQANIMKQYMDAEADPCHDFYQYACGNWPALNPIPADKAGYVTFCKANIFLTLTGTSLQL